MALSTKVLWRVGCFLHSYGSYRYRFFESEKEARRFATDMFDTDEPRLMRFPALKADEILAMQRDNDAYAIRLVYFLQG